MAIGRCPTIKLIDQYQLLEYKEMVGACLQGDMKALEAAIERNMDIYIQSGVFTVLERIKMVTLRNFIKRIYTAVVTDTSLQHTEGKPNNIHLDLIHKPLLDWDSNLELDELEFLLANLVESKLLAGYISHSHQLLVLGKTPFPELS